MPAIERTGAVYVTTDGVLHLEGASTTKRLRGFWPFQWWETVEVVRRPSRFAIGRAVIKQRRMHAQRGHGRAH